MDMYTVRLSKESEISSLVNHTATQEKHCLHEQRGNSCSMSRSSHSAATTASPEVHDTGYTGYTGTTTTTHYAWT
jgi:hypothetical protein